MVLCASIKKKFNTPQKITKKIIIINDEITILKHIQFSMRHENKIVFFLKTFFVKKKVYLFWLLFIACENKIFY